MAEDKKIEVLDITNKVTTASPAKLLRNLIVVGCGDGGVNIMNRIRTKVPEAYTVAYNSRVMEGLQSDVKITPQRFDGRKVDGSGKDREYSKKILKAGSHQILMENIQKLLKSKEIDYILVCSTTGGGTGSGSSPAIAKILEQNFDVPVIILGVLPALTEDSVAQYNALNWMSEVHQYELPYIIMDNQITLDSKNGPASTFEIHDYVNKYAASMSLILSNHPFHETPISKIDNQDIYTLISQFGQRISIYGSENQHPKVGQSLDDFLIDIIESNPRMQAPKNAKAMALFLRGPESFIQSADTQLPKLHERYGGTNYTPVHLEISNTYYVGMIFTGSEENTDRLIEISNRYKEANVQLKGKSMAADLVNSMENPFSHTSKKAGIAEGESFDFSVLG